LEETGYTADTWKKFTEVKTFEEQLLENGSFYLWMLLAACDVIAYAGQCRKNKMCQKNNRKK